MLQAMRNLPNAANVRWPDQPYNYLRRTFPELSDAGLALLNGLLTYDASQRLTAQQALKHEYLRVRILCFCLSPGTKFRSCSLLVDVLNLAEGFCLNFLLRC